MKKFIILFFMFIFSAFSVSASDIKFVQVDSLKFSPDSETSVSDLKNLVNDINEQKDISFVIFSGDNIAKSDKKYLEEFLKKSKKLKAPFYIALGHKDINKKKGLSKDEYIKIVKRLSHKNINSPTYVFKTKNKNIVFITADGSKEFIATPFGYYRDNVINKIDTELTKYANKKVVILQHFPINPPAESEAFNTYKAEEYFKMLKSHNNVLAIISGFKVNSETDIDGIKHITTADFPQYRIIEIIDSESNNPTIWSNLKQE